jgi:hypothetical protein
VLDTLAGMSAWSFRRRHGTCTRCEREFEGGEAHFSTLIVEGEELAREDLCRACWRKHEAQAGDGENVAQDAPAVSAPGKAWHFWWRTRYEVGRKHGLALNLEAIEALFLGLEGRGETRLRELRYVLCLLLMRKRRLKIVRISRDEQGEALIVRRPRREEALRVFVFDFDAQRMAQLRDELQRVFDSDEGLASLALGHASQEAPGVDGAGDGDESEPADQPSDVGR